MKKAIAVSILAIMLLGMLGIAEGQYWNNQYYHSYGYAPSYMYYPNYGYGAWWTNTQGYYWFGDSYYRTQYNFGRLNYRGW
jgi:hypothetical protein